MPSPATNNLPAPTIEPRTRPVTARRKDRAWVCRAHLARPHEQAGLRKARQAQPPHGRDGRNQNRLAQNQLSAIAASKIPPRLLAGTIKSQVLLGIFIAALPILIRRHIANAVDHPPKRHTDLSAVMRAHRSALSRALTQSSLKMTRSHRPLEEASYCSPVAPAERCSFPRSRPGFGSGLESSARSP